MCFLHWNERDGISKSLNVCCHRTHTNTLIVMFIFVQAWVEPSFFYSFDTLDNVRYCINMWYFKKKRQIFDDSDYPKVILKASIFTLSFHTKQQKGVAHFQPNNNGNGEKGDSLERKEEPCDVSSLIVSAHSAALASHAVG